MAHDKSYTDEAKAAMNTIDPNDPDIMARLNEIALEIAKKQGKIPAKPASAVPNIASDPMDRLGCEGCQ